MFEEFNKEKTYIGLQFGTSLIAKKIAKYSKAYCPHKDTVPTHIIALKYQFDDWYIYESTHTARLEIGLNSGVRHYNSEKFKKLEEDKINEYKFYQVDLDIKTLDELLGEQYAMKSIKDLMLASLHRNNGKQEDRQGLICSEYVARACKDITDYFDLPAWCITPAHWYRYVLDKKIEEIRE